MDTPEFHGDVFSFLSGRYELVSVDVMENPAPGGPRHVVRVSLDADDGFLPVPLAIADLWPDSARALGDILAAAADVAIVAETDQAVGFGVRRLPVVRLCGTDFFVDARLRELRSVVDPTHRVGLGDAA